MAPWTNGILLPWLACAAGLRQIEALHEQQHPICRLFALGDKQHPEHFPANYWCSSDDPGAICSSEVLDFRSGYVRDNVGDGIVDSDTRPVDEVAQGDLRAWTLYHGDSSSAFNAINDVHSIRTIDCAGYFAVERETAQRGRDDRWEARDVDLALSSIDVSRPGLRGAEGKRILDDAESYRLEEPFLSLSIGAAQVTSIKKSDFVNAANKYCDPAWSSWAAIQHQGLTAETVIVFELFPSVGNLFMVLDNLLAVARYLEVAVVLKCDTFEGFCSAFKPAEVIWNRDPEPFLERARTLEGTAEAELTALSFKDGAMILSQEQLERLTSIMSFPATSITEVANGLLDPYHAGQIRFVAEAISWVLKRNNAGPKMAPCAWNFFLQRSAELMRLMDAHSPWAHRDNLSATGAVQQYAAWHIRTAEGESKHSYRPEAHPYVVQEAPDVVCHAFVDAMMEAMHACSTGYAENIPVYISSNSKDMAESCSDILAQHNIMVGFARMGLGHAEGHTEFSRNPQTAMNAFVDMMFLMDASVLVRTGSSFSAVPVRTKEMACRKMLSNRLAKRNMAVCMPNECVH